jgi:amino acid efflux transporter
MSGLTRELTLKDGIALAIGSIAGSGILFLPSLTYSIGGPDVLLIWIGGTLLCFPMLFMFTDMVKAVPDGSGIEGFIAKGLGRHAAASVPILFLSLVSIGIPSGSLVAGEYLKNAVAHGQAVQVIGALAIVLIAIAINLTGIKMGALIQTVITWGLLAIAVLLCAFTFPYAKGNYGAVVPVFSALSPILSGIVVAFWAYAGFENLTFIAGEFKNPKRDFFLAMAVAFVAYGGLAVALTANIAAIIPREQVNKVAGLYQLAEKIQPTGLSTWVITVFALALMQINANSWLWGISRLLYASAGARRMPSYFAQLNDKNLPRRAILALGTVFVVMTCVFAFFPHLLVEALMAASSVFMFLYVLFLLSYLVSERRGWKTVLAAGLLIFLVITLFGAGVHLLYPVVVFVLALTASILRERKAQGPAGAQEASS